MPYTLSAVRTLLSDYAGANNDFEDRLNMVCARLLQAGNWPGSKQQIKLTVYADAAGTSIVTLPRRYKTILAGAVQNENVLCSGQPMGVRNSWSEFSKNGLGYGGLSDDFTEVTGRFSVFQEWTDPMYIRFKFERSESAGSIYISGTLDGEDVWALNGATWEKREAVAFSGTTNATSTKLYDADQFKIKKPVTNGRVSAYTVDTDGNETLVGVYEPSETLVRWKRYKVPECADVSAIESETAAVASQVYTQAEIQSQFADGGSITVNSATDSPQDLAFDPFFIKTVTIIAQDGAASYTHKFTLDTTGPFNGAMMYIPLEIAASADPTLEFYNESAAGTLLQSIPPDSSNAQYMTLVFRFNGTIWRYLGRMS